MPKHSRPSAAYGHNGISFKLSPTVTPLIYTILSRFQALFTNFSGKNGSSHLKTGASPKNSGYNMQEKGQGGEKTRERLSFPRTARLQNACRALVKTVGSPPPSGPENTLLLVRGAGVLEFDSGEDPELVDGEADQDEGQHPRRRRGGAEVQVGERLVPDEEPGGLRPGDGVAARHHEDAPRRGVPGVDEGSHEVDDDQRLQGREDHEEDLVDEGGAVKIRRLVVVLGDPLQRREVDETPGAHPRPHHGDDARHHGGVGVEEPAVGFAVGLEETTEQLGTGDAQGLMSGENHREGEGAHRAEEDEAHDDEDGHHAPQPVEGETAGEHEADDHEDGPDADEADGGDPQHDLVQGSEF